MGRRPGTLTITPGGRGPEAPPTFMSAQRGTWNVEPAYLRGRGLEVGAGLLLDGREELLERLTPERLEVRLLERLTLARLEVRLLERLTLERDLELLEGRLDRTEEEEGRLPDVRTAPLLRETLEPREELLPVTLDREVVERDRDPTVEFLDPLLLPDFEKRLPTLLRGIVVTRGRAVRLRLDEEVNALPALRESVLELISRAVVLVLEELVATLLRELPVPVDVT